MLQEIRPTASRIANLLLRDEIPDSRMAATPLWRIGGLRWKPPSAHGNSPTGGYKS